MFIRSFKVLAISTVALFIFNNTVFSQEGEKAAKPEAKKASPTAVETKAQPEPKVVPFSDLKNKWNAYAKDLEKAFQTQGTIEYEKQVISKMINHIKPVLDELNSAKTEPEQQAARSKVNLGLIGLRIIEQEYKRAEGIRKLLVQVQKSGDKDLMGDLQSLPQLSNDIFVHEVKLANAQAKFATINARINRISSNMSSLKEKAEGNAAKLDKLKKTNPKLYQELFGKEEGKKEKAQ